jgi:hypothetical protein
MLIINLTVWSRVREPGVTLTHAAAWPLASLDGLSFP